MLASAYNCSSGRRPVQEVEQRGVAKVLPRDFHRTRGGSMARTLKVNDWVSMVREVGATPKRIA